MVSRVGDFVVLGSAAAIFLAQQLAISWLDVEGGTGVLRQVLFFSTTVLLAALALHFRRFWGAWLVSLGIVMNLVPMAAHEGSMPIDYGIIERSGEFPEVTRDDIGKQTNHGKDVVLEREDIHFFELSDRYIVTLPWYGANIYSLGDFVLFAGVGAVVVQAVGQAALAAARKGEQAQPPTSVRS
jgi:hypothetical protein